MLNYEDAVKEGTQTLDREKGGHWRLGELADGVATTYGDKTLERYANDIDINVNTLRRYRAMVRKYQDPNIRPKSMAVAKALASHLDREDIIRNYPNITEAQALMAVKEFKKRRKRGKYNDLVLHALIAKACQIFNAMLSERSELEHVLAGIEIYKEIDLEYIVKILEAAQGARDRIDARIDKIRGK